jgi:sensor histidine kinase YesM
MLTIREKHETNPAQWQNLSWTIEKPFWQTNVFIAACLLIISILVYFFTQRRITAIREKAALQQKMAETEMAALQAQMNPHFIFNSINCIDAMVQEGDKYNATTYLNKFAKLLRNVLEGSRNTTVSLTSDMETLRLYIELECMRMDENFEWEIELPDEVAAADIRVPSLIIQPYVENAILHGLRHLTGKKGILKVKVGLNGDVLSYQITDNGVGREFAKTIQKTQHTSFGLDITRERIEHFNLGNRGSVTITDLKNEKGEPGGTEVKVLLPLN